MLYHEAHLCRTAGNFAENRAHDLTITSLQVLAGKRRSHAHHQHILLQGERCRRLKPGRKRGCIESLAQTFQCRLPDLLCVRVHVAALTSSLPRCIKAHIYAFLLTGRFFWPAREKSWMIVRLFRSNGTEKRSASGRTFSTPARRRQRTPRQRQHCWCSRG